MSNIRVSNLLTTCFALCGLVNLATTASLPTDPDNLAKRWTNNKRGVAFNNATLARQFGTFGSQVTWGYNWGQVSEGYGGGWPSVEYVPMLWSLDSGLTSTWDANVNVALAAGSGHLMSFNEPDLSDQANLTPAEAAAGFMKYMQPYAGRASLGGPAITAGGLPWLVEFYGNCTACSIDFQPIHWYDEAWNIWWFKAHLEQVWAVMNPNSRIWVTEFAGWGSADDQITFMETVMPWMDSTYWIDRYAYFGAMDGSLIETVNGVKQRSKMGQVYDTYYTTTVPSSMTS